MDTVSNGGFLPFAAGAILSPLPGELGRQYGPCDYDVVAFGLFCNSPSTPLRHLWRRYCSRAYSESPWNCRNLASRDGGRLA